MRRTLLCYVVDDKRKKKNRCTGRHQIKKCQSRVRTHSHSQTLCHFLVPAEGVHLADSYLGKCFSLIKTHVLIFSTLFFLGIVSSW